MRLFLFTCFVLSVAPSCLFSQGSPAFDSNVYFPDFDNAEEIETVVGTSSKPYHGKPRTLPASEVSPYGQLMFSGPQNSNGFLNLLKGGPNFTIADIENARRLNLREEEFREIEYYFGHFRGKRYTDILCKNFNFNGYRIYWSDEEGNYSTDDFTSLAMPADTAAIDRWPDKGAYITDLNDDGMDDLVLLAEFNEYIVNRPKWHYIYQYDASTDWRSKDSIYPTAHIVRPPGRLYDFRDRRLYPADYRGTGGKDVVARDNHGNLLFYGFDRPFLLEEFQRALEQDTIWAVWQNPAVKYPENTNWNIYPMQAIPDKTSFSAEELTLFYDTYDDRDQSIFMYKGGEEFGNKRLFLDSADFVMYPPWHYDSRFNGLGITQIDRSGDITGTGNGSLLRQVLDADATYYMFYVLGEALDDKVDMTFYTVGTRHSGHSDSLTVNGDKYQDVAIVNDSYEQGKGAMHIVKGSSKIPVRLNTLYAKVKEQSEKTSVMVHPNPFHVSVRVELPEWKGERVTLSIRDVLGREAYVTVASAGGQAYDLRPDIGEGYYFLQVKGARRSIEIPIVKN